MVSARYLKEFSFGQVHFSVEFIGASLKSIVGSLYFTVSEFKPYARDTDSPTAFLGWMTRVRVDKLSCSSVKTQFDLFFGKLDKFFFEPTRW